MKYIIMASCFTILMAASCKKNKPPKTELEKLPPITQTGANTFGCLLNGQAWLPKDNYGQASFTLQADPTFENGSFGVSAKKYENDANFFAFSFGSDSVQTIGSFPFSNKRNNISISITRLSCLYSTFEPNVFVNGSFSITKYDLTNRIFSGTFDFTIYKEGCGDTLHFTNGRFDKKL